MKIGTRDNPTAGEAKIPCLLYPFGSLIKDKAGLMRSPQIIAMHPQKEQDG